MSLTKKAFRQELLDQMAGQAGEHHYAEDRYESDEQKALRIIKTELKRLRWEAEELACRLKGDRGKVRIAMRLRQETTMTLISELIDIPEQVHKSDFVISLKTAIEEPELTMNARVTSWPPPPRPGWR